MGHRLNDFGSLENSLSFQVRRINKGACILSAQGDYTHFRNLIPLLKLGIVSATNNGLSEQGGDP